MKKIFVLTIGMLFVASTAVFGMEDTTIECRKAKPSDSNQIVSLFNTARESDNLFIFPHCALKNNVGGNIKKKALFVAYKNEEMVSMRKLYIPTNPEDINFILNDEIRLTGPGSERAQKDRFYNIEQLLDKKQVTPYKTENYPGIQKKIVNDKTLIIYSGSAYTKKEYRNQGINSKLTNYAFNQHLESTVKKIKQRNMNAICLVFGLAKNNKKQGRAITEARYFAKFINNIRKKLPSITETTIIHRQSKAQLPTCDPNAKELIINPDPKEGPQDFGNAFFFPFNQKNSEN